MSRAGSGSASTASTGEHHGGQLSEGRLHATGHILEAVQQVRGTAGARQAVRADHAVVSSAYPTTVRSPSSKGLTAAGYAEGWSGRGCDDEGAR